MGLGVHGAFNAKLCGEPLPGLRCLSVLTRCVLAVLQWVNGSDAAFQAALHAHAEENPTAAHMPHKFRDWDELRYSLRSVRRHAAIWVKNIYIVTQYGQRPHWLRADQTAVRVVDLASLLTKEEALEYLPTVCVCKWVGCVLRVACV